MRVPRVKWTDEENEYIRRHYKKRTNDELQAIADHIGRTLDAVKMQALRLELYQRGKQPKWKPEDDAFLRHHWMVRSDKWIAKQLGRDIGGIEARRQKLGLYRRKLSPVVFSVTAVAKAVGLDEHSVLRWVERGWLKAKKKPGRTAQWEIKPRDLREFLKANPDKWDSRKAPGIIQAINGMELEKSMRKWRQEAEFKKRKLPEDLRPAFAMFVADVAMSGSECIKECRSPGWYRKKMDHDTKIAERHLQRWTPEEDRMLRKMFIQCLNYTQMAEKLGRSYAGVAHRMGYVNIWEA